ncbi:MAG: hypothetical protein WAK16_04415 [Candidatus Cybelea sp.]
MNILNPISFLGAAGCSTVVALALGGANPGSAGSDLASVTLQVIQCPLDRSEAPALSLAPAAAYPKLEYIGANASVQRAEEGYYLVTIAVAQGNYFFKLQSTHCSNYLQAAVLQGRSRTLSLPLFTIAPKGRFNVKLFDSENALAGTLPVRPDVAWLVADGGGKRVLDLQDGAYYLDRLPPAKYKIRMELHGSYQSEIPLDLSRISPTQFVEHNLDMATIRKNLGKILASGDTLKDCEYCY